MNNTSVAVPLKKLTLYNATDVLHWMFPDIEPDAEANNLTIKTLEGDLHASPGDYIIKGV